MSELVKLPDFLPGAGTLYVDPKPLPEGPFLAYDHAGRLVSTIYMVPLKELNEHVKFEELGAVDAKVDHVDMYYNAGHPGVEQHIITSCFGTCRRQMKRPSPNDPRRGVLRLAGVFATLVLRRLRQRNR